MPLFGRRLFFPPEDIPSTSSEPKEIFRIEHTAEEYSNRDIYQKLIQIYSLERWTCQCTWKAGLTHQQAYRSEIEIRKTLSELVPEYFHRPILELVHHSVKTLEKLTEEISSALSQSFFVGQPVQFRKKKESNHVKGVIERVEDNEETKKRSSEKLMKTVKYTVRLLAENEIISHVTANELQRGQMIPNREKLKTFIRSFAIRLGNRSDSPWVFYDDSTQVKYQIKDRLPLALIEPLKKANRISLLEIVREHERHVRKQMAVAAEEKKQNERIVPTVISDDDIQIILSDDEDLSALFKEKPPTPKKKQKKSTKKDEKRTTDKSDVNTCDIVLPLALLQRLEKMGRERGVDSKPFQRLIIQCARTLNEKQILRFPEEYRPLIRSKQEQLEMKRRISQMTEEEKKLFFQSKRLEEKPVEDTELDSSKDLPIPKSLENSLSLRGESIGKLLMISSFLNSSHSLFSLSLTDDFSKSDQQTLRSFKMNCLSKNFIEILQLLIKLLFKEEEDHSQEEQDENETNEKPSNDDNNNNIGEQLYHAKINDIPLSVYTCQELTRLYLLNRNEQQHNAGIVQKLGECETNNFTVEEQIELLTVLIDAITTKTELMSDYFEHLNQKMSEAARERQQLLSERRKIQEGETKSKKLKLQNFDQDKINPKKRATIIPIVNGTQNDENRHVSSTNFNDDMMEFDDDLKTVLQRRRQMVAMSKELKEKRELEAQKQQLEQKRQMALDKVEQIYQEARLDFQYGFRVKPLGYDRFYNRYWLFRGQAGVFVEKGWMDFDDASFIINDKTLPKNEPNQWLIYDDRSSIDQLMNALNNRGIREHHLLTNLKKSMPFIEQEFEQIRRSKVFADDEENNFTDEFLDSFRTELEDIEMRLRLGSLGGFTNGEQLQRWQNKLKCAKQRRDVAELILQLQQTVPEKYSSGIFSLDEKKYFDLWTEDCRNSQTYSRLFVLMMIFENSITWNKSPVGIKCKICRKKQKDESILVCDQCCHGFHLECFRSSLRVAPNSANARWYCPTCRPPESHAKRREQKRPATDEFSLDEEEENSRSTVDGELCCVCSSDTDLFSCQQCQKFYHNHCHQPPLRFPPRSNTWICNACRNGTQKVKKSDKVQRRSKRLRRSTRQNSNGEDDESNSMDFDDHQSSSSLE